MLRWQGTLRTQESSEQDLEHERTSGEERCQHVLNTHCSFRQAFRTTLLDH